MQIERNNTNSKIPKDQWLYDVPKIAMFREVVNKQVYAIARCVRINNIFMDFALLFLIQS